MYKFVICLVLAALLGQVDPHGYLNYPPQRSTMWRHGLGTPVNYDDNGLNCGGRQTEIDNGGKCGVCGDDYSATIKPNEAGGKYATGKIAATFQPGASVKAEVIITANHLGFFEFRLCPHNDVTTPVSQSCLDQHLLQVGNGTNLGTRYYIGSDTGSYNMTLHLPAGLTCSQCVLQWKYTTGNHNGYGEAEQEHFVNCADIAIDPQGPQQSTQWPPSTPEPTTRQTQAPPTTLPTTTPATSRPTAAPAVTGSSSSSRKCVGVGIWRLVQGMDTWCFNNCFHNPSFCPISYCNCSLGSESGVLGPAS